MAITSTNRTDISYIEEVTAGTTPATPAFQILPTTGGSPMSDITTVVSEVIRSDRMTDDLVLTDLEVTGEINYELSYTPYKAILQAALRNNLTTIAVSGATDIAVDATGDQLTSSSTNFVSEGLLAGMSVKVAGFTEAGNNGVYYITSVAANALGVTKTGLVNEAAGDTISIDAVYLTNGEANQKSFSLMKRVLGITSPAYFYYRGCQINEMSMNFETGSILAGTFSIIGLTEEITTTAISGQTTVDPPDYDLMNAVSSVTSIDLGGLTGASSFSTMNLQFNNNINSAKAIGTLGAVDLAAFTLEVSAEVNLYFEDKSLYDFYKQANSFSARFTLQDGSGNIMVVNMPKCKFETLETPIDGKDNFFMANGSFRALRDSTLNHMISISFMDA